MKNNKIISVVALLTLVVALAATAIPNASATTVTLTKSKSPLTNLEVGEEVTFTVTLDVKTDVGGSQVPITNLNVTDTLPPGLAYVAGSQSSTPAAASFTAVGQVLTWRYTATLSSTPQVTITFRAAATGSPVGTLLNQVSTEYMENGEIYSNPTTTASVTVVEPQPTASPTPEPSRPPPVGGEALPVNTLQVLSPYMIVAAIGIAAIAALFIYKKKTT